jgi:hypothetical protein
MLKFLETNVIIKEAEKILKDCKYRTAATLCTLQTWFVSGI